MSENRNINSSYTNNLTTTRPSSYSKPSTPVISSSRPPYTSTIPRQTRTTTASAANPSTGHGASVYRSNSFNPSSYTNYSSHHHHYYNLSYLDYISDDGMYDYSAREDLNKKSYLEDDDECYCSSHYQHHITHYPRIY